MALNQYVQEIVQEMAKTWTLEGLVGRKIELPDDPVVARFQLELVGTPFYEDPCPLNQPFSYKKGLFSATKYLQIVFLEIYDVWYPSREDLVRSFPDLISERRPDPPEDWNRPKLLFPIGLKTLRLLRWHGPVPRIPVGTQLQLAF